MRSLITKILVGAALLTGGVASADSFDGNRDHRTDTTVVTTSAPTQVARRDDGDRRDDRDAPPPPKFERHRERRGYVWISGQWTKEHHRWVWQPGHYERIRRDGGFTGNGRDHRY